MSDVATEPSAPEGGYRFTFHPAGGDAPPVVVAHLDNPDAAIIDIGRLRTGLREQGIDPNVQHVVYRDVETGRWEDLHPVGRMLRLRAETQDEALATLARRRAPKGDEPCLVATATRDGGLELRVDGELMGVWYEGMSLAEVRDGGRRKEETEAVAS